MDVIGSLNHKLDNYREPNKAKNFSFPNLEFSYDKIAKSKYTKCKYWEQKSFLLVRDQAKHDKVENSAVHHLWALILLQGLLCVEIYSV